MNSKVYWQSKKIAEGKELMKQLKENNLLTPSGNIRSLYYMADEVQQDPVLRDVLAVPHYMPHLIYWSYIWQEREGNMDRSIVMETVSPYLVHMTDEERKYVEEQLVHVCTFYTVLGFNAYEADIILYVDINGEQLSMQITSMNMMDVDDDQILY